MKVGIRIFACYLIIFTVCSYYSVNWMKDKVRIRYLEGVLRICSYCKRVDAGGRWVAFETYITEHSAALFSHGLCPDCARQHYPDQFQTSGTNEAQT